jgi:hypothetical protein
MTYTGFLTRVIRRVPLVDQELCTFPEHLILSPIVVVLVLLNFSVKCFVDYCLFFFSWLIYCLSFKLPLLNTPSEYLFGIFTLLTSLLLWKTVNKFHKTRIGVGDPIIRDVVGIPVTCLTHVYCCACPNPGHWCNQCPSPRLFWVQIPFRWGVLDTALCDKSQWLATCRWFSTDLPVSSTNKTYLHDIAKIFLKVTLNTISKQVTNQPTKKKLRLEIWFFYQTELLKRQKNRFSFFICKTTGFIH